MSAQATPGPKSRPKMRFGMNFGQQRPFSEIIQWYKAAEKVGVEEMGIPDSPAQFQEIYVTSTLCALNTTKATIVGCVSNPMTRHPSVTASALGSVDELAPGRVALGIATGDSAIWGVKGKYSTVAHLKEYILAVKGMLRGEEVEYEGARFRSAYRQWKLPKNIPVYVACSGPKVLKMAAQVADGFFIAMGYAPENIQYVRDIIKEGCAEVGRDPNELDICWQGGITFANSVEEAMERNIGVNINWMVMGSMEGKQIPEQYKEPLKKMTEGWHQFESSGYLNPNAGRDTVKRAKELGIYDWLITRSSRLWGTPDDVAKRYAEFRDMGLTHWMYTVAGLNNDRFDIINKVGQVIRKLK